MSITDSQIRYAQKCLVTETWLSGIRPVCISILRYIPARRSIVFQRIRQFTSSIATLHVLNLQNRKPESAVSVDNITIPIIPGNIARGPPP